MLLLIIFQLNSNFCSQLFALNNPNILLIYAQQNFYNCFQRIIRHDHFSALIYFIIKNRKAALNDYARLILAVSILSIFDLKFNY